MDAATVRGKRVYRSSRRGAQARRTRQRVLAAATSVFLARGYAGCTIRAVAAEAGVSVPTVEQLFHTKARLLKAAIDVAIAGDDDPVPVLGRSWVDAAVATRGVEDFLAVVADVVGPAQSRSAGLVLAVFEGASTDPELAALARRLVDQRTTTAEFIVDALVEKAPLPADSNRRDAIETLWILMDPAVFDRLVSHRQWTVQEYQAWFARSVRRLLTAGTTDTTEGTTSPDRRTT